MCCIGTEWKTSISACCIGHCVCLEGRFQYPPFSYRHTGPKPYPWSDGISIDKCCVLNSEQQTSTPRLYLGNNELLIYPGHLGVVVCDSLSPTLHVNNNNNNNQICIAQVCRMTSEALDGQLQSCYTARARPKCMILSAKLKEAPCSSHVRSYHGCGVTCSCVPNLR